jgi:hypothetical protein
MKTVFRAVLVIASLSFLYSCDNEEDPKTDKAPVVSIVGTPTNLTVELGGPVTLDASTSKDPEGKTLTFNWEILTQPAGSTVSLTNFNTEKLTFLPTAEGDYKLKLTCSDGSKVSAQEVIIKVVIGTIPFPQMITFDIATDTIWKNINPTPGGPDYILKNAIDVNAKLTIQPGVLVQAEGNSELYIGVAGKLVAIGTATDHIIFTGSNSTGPAWKGISIASSSTENELNFVEINFAGSALLKGLSNTIASIGLDGENAAKLKIQNTQINKGGGYGIYVEDNASLTTAENIEIKEVLGTSLALPLNQLGNISANNKFKGNNGYNAIEVLGSEINLPAETTWKGFEDGTSYSISGNLSVKSGLVIQPGVNIEFATEKFMEVSGADAYVSAFGSAERPISFSGKSKVKGFWKGIVISSPSLKNRMDHVNISHAGSSFLPGLHNITACLGIDGDNLANVSLTNSVISEGKGYGFYIGAGAVLTEFSSNEIKNMNGTSISLPADYVGKLDAASKFSNGNTVNAVEIQNTVLNQTEEVQWKAFTDGTKYLVNGNLEIRSGLRIEAGAIFEFNSDRTFVIENESNAYIIAKGTAAKKIVFTGKNKSKGYWKGVAILSNSANNEFDYVEISNAGGGFLVGLSNTYTNLGLDGDNGAKLKITNSLLSNGKGWGLVAEAGATLNPDFKTSNTFTSNDAGAYKAP